MKETRFFYAPDIISNPVLPESESAHAIRVMRLCEGDPLVVADGRGHLYDCEVTAASPRQCMVGIKAEKEFVPLVKGRITLAMAPTKNMDRTEWLAEKATEISLSHIVFLLCDNSERKIVKEERIEKIVVSAMKQSHNAFKPEVTGMTSFKDFINMPIEGQRYIAHCYQPEDVAARMAAKYPGEGFDANKPFLGDIASGDSDITTCIGPEGDFSVDEVCDALHHGFRQVSLGRNRLRTETAGLTATYLMYLAQRIE